MKVLLPRGLEQKRHFFLNKKYLFLKNFPLKSRPQKDKKKKEISLKSILIEKKDKTFKIFKKRPFRLMEENASTFLEKPSLKKFSSSDQTIYKWNVDIVTNLFFVGLNEKETQNVYLFGICAKELFPKTNEDFPVGLMKLIKFSKEFNIKMNEIFDWFYISGLILFGRPKLGKELSKKKFKIFIMMTPKREIVVLTESPKTEEFTERNQNTYYTFEFIQKKTISDYIKVSGTEKEFNQVYRSFINIIMGKLLLGCGYKKDVETRKTLYYNSNFIDLKVINRQIKDFNLYAHDAFKAVSDIYEGGKIYFKILPRYILLHQQTYFDYYLLMKEDPQFKNENEVRKVYVEMVLQQKRGIKRYNKKSEKIEDVIFKNPFEIYFERGGANITVGEYYYNIYGINLENVEQPIAVRYIDKGGKLSHDECPRIYIPMKCLLIVGNILDLKVDVRDFISPPREKYHKIMSLREKIIEEYKEEKQTNESSEMIKTIDCKLNPLKFSGKTLKFPLILFGNDIKKEPKEDGSFSVEKTSPYKKAEQTLKDFEIFSLGTSDTEVYNLINLLYEAGESMGIKIEYEGPPKKIEYYKDEKVFEESLKEMFDDISKTKCKSGNAIEFIFIIIQEKYKKQYKTIKNVLNNSELRVPSQVIIYDKRRIENNPKKLSMGSNILTQVCGKRSAKIFSVDFSFARDTIVLAYSVMAYKDKMITSICASYTKEKTDYVFLSDICSSNNSRLATNIRKMMRDAILSVWKYIKFNVKNLVVYREGVNDKQIKILKEFELPEILDGIKSAIEKIKENKDEKYKKQREFFTEPKLLYIMANKISEVKMFYKSDSPGNNAELIYNIPVGTIVDKHATTEEYFDFYLNSTYSSQGTCNPTHYFVLYDETELSADLIFKLTFNLTFLSYNTTRSIKLPAPLYFVSRRNKFTKDNLDTVISKKIPKIYNISL